MSAPDLHGGKIREAAAALGLPACEILDFSANINFLGPTPAVVEAARRAVSEMAWYPLDPPAPLRRAASEFLGVPEAQVLLGNGASELISLVVAHLRPRRVLVVGPTFTEYGRAARAWGAEVDTLCLPAERDFTLVTADFARLGLADRVARADLVFLCDPNNPTGALQDRGGRDALLALAARAGVPVLVDESFLAFTAAWPEGSATRERLPNLLVLHSFTKILALPGLRVGALAVPPAMAPTLGLRVPPWNLNCVVQAAALAGFAEREVLAATPGAVAAARQELVAALTALPGIEQVLPADANFICLKLEEPGAARVTAALRERHGILIRDLTDFPGMGPVYLRSAVRRSEENAQLVRALADVLAGAPGSEGLQRGRGLPAQSRQQAQRAGAA